MPRMNPLGAIIDIVESFPAVDLHTGANTGDWINVKSAWGALLLLAGGVGNSADPLVVTFQQAKDNAGGSAKALNISTTANFHAWKKEAATNLTAIAAWSDASAGVSTDTYTTGAGNLDKLGAIFIDMSELDVNNGFNHIQATVAQAATASQPGACLWILMLDYPNSPANVLSPIG